jgi:hypothetical protein
VQLLGDGHEVPQLACFQTGFEGVHHRSIRGDTREV